MGRMGRWVDTTSQKVLVLGLASESQMSGEAGCPATDDVNVNRGQGRQDGRARDRTLHWDPEGILGA